MQNNRRLGQLSIPAFIAIIIIGILQVIGNNANYQATQPTPFPTHDFLATMAVQRQTQDAMQAAQLGITLEPSTDALSALVQLRYAAFTQTPEPNKLLTYCVAMFQDTSTEQACPAWVEQVINEHPADIAYCQSHPETAFDACLREHDIPLPG